MRSVGLKLDSSIFTASIAKILRKYITIPISEIKQLVLNDDYLYQCDIISKDGIKTVLQIKKDLEQEAIKSGIYVEEELISEEYLNNLLESYKQIEVDVEEEMDREALLEESELNQ